MIYSHDTYGLGHLRRSLAIANALVDRFDNITVLIISGSVLADAFAVHERIILAKIPSVIKFSNGAYDSADTQSSLEQTIDIRKQKIIDIAQDFAPDIFLVDKEPCGLHGEVLPTLEMLRAKGAFLILGLRDVLDEATSLTAEWNKKGAFDAIEAFYDEVWIYGPEDFYNPLQEQPISNKVQSRARYLGFLRRESRHQALTRSQEDQTEETVLIMAGGGGDGRALMYAAINAIQYASYLLPEELHYTFMLGPFMPDEEQKLLHEHAARYPQITMRQFDNQIEALYQKARLVIAMGGYNTFCEIMSFNKRALILPRRKPRLEQWLRIERASALDLVSTLDLKDARDPVMMAQSITKALNRPCPSSSSRYPDFDGLERLCDRVAVLIMHRLQCASAAI